MTDEQFSFFIGIVVGILTAFVVISIYHEMRSVPKYEVIKHNCGEYNLTTGSFQWKDNL